MKISILISTLNERIENVKDVILSPRSGIEYIVSHQYTDDVFKYIPSALKRNDVTISQIAGKGVSKSRNNAMRLAAGDIGLFADDDVTYRPEYITTVQQAFLNHPDADIILFKIKTRPGEPEYKNYTSEWAELKELTHSISTVEIAYRVDRLKNIGVCFDERFGAGQKLLVNTEESIFIDDCIKCGAKVIFIPKYIVEHPYESTTKLIPKYDKRRNWVTGAYDCRKNGKKALIKALFGTLKIVPDLLKHGTNPIVYFYHRLSAVIYILRTNLK